MSGTRDEVLAVQVAALATATAITAGQDDLALEIFVDTELPEDLVRLYLAQMREMVEVARLYGPQALEPVGLRLARRRWLP